MQHDDAVHFVKARLRHCLLGARKDLWLLLFWCFFFGSASWRCLQQLHTKASSINPAFGSHVSGIQQALQKRPMTTELLKYTNHANSNTFAYEVSALWQLIRIGE